MATTVDSRIIYQDGNGTVGYELAYDLLSQNTANNTSTVRLYGILHVNMGSVYWTRGSASVHTSGLQPIGTSYSRGDHIVITWDFTWGHDANGNFSVYIGASLSTTFISADIGGVLTLPKINRYAIVTSATDFNDEGNPTITYTNPAGFRINARLEFGSQAIRRDNILNTGSYTFNLTDVERAKLRGATTTSNSRTVREVIATCISGTTESYWSWQDKKMTIINANPTFSNFTFADINNTTTALTGNNQYCIRGYSNIQATISTTDKATAKKQATMTKYQFNCGTNSPVQANFSDDSDVTLTINKATIGTFEVYAIDSRNNSKKVTKLATKDIAYKNITMNALNCTIQRDDNNVGTHAILNLEGKMWKGNFGAVNNAIKSVTYKFKKTNDTTWTNGITSISPTVDNSGNITFNGQIANTIPTWDLDASYNVQVIIKDKLSSATVNLILNSAIPTMSLDKNGVGVMCAYDDSIGGLLQVGGRIIDGLEHYSTDEQVIGTWINEELLYSKSFSGSLSRADGYISTGLSNCTIIEITGTFVSDMYSIPVNFYNTQHMFLHSNTTGSSLSYHNGFATNFDYYITIKYLKNETTRSLNQIETNLDKQEIELENKEEVN